MEQRKKLVHTGVGKPAGNHGIYIGIPELAIVEMVDQLLRMMLCEASDAVKVRAMETLEKRCTISNVSISDCTFSETKKGGS